MKKIFLIIMFCLGLSCINSCTKPEDKICACGVKNPAKNLPWLAEFIETAENDETGRYFGVMWLVSYQEQDYFIAEMPLIGSYLYVVFDCEGKYIFFENHEDELNFIHQLKKEAVIYVSPGYPLNE